MYMYTYIYVYMYWREREMDIISNTSALDDAYENAMPLCVCTSGLLCHTQVQRASHLRQIYSFSYWDSNIVAAALEAQSMVLYPEDMHDGLLVNDQLRIVNPLK